VRASAFGAAALLAACAGGPPPTDWQLNARGALTQYQLPSRAGDTQRAEREFVQAKAEIARSGRADLLARAELVRCAVRTASLEFDDCPGFEGLRADAGADETAYADYLAGRAVRAPTEEPLSRLVAAGVRLRGATLTPEGIASAVEIASAQGWRRPLLAWLGVQAMRAEQAGDKDSANRIRRRMELTAAGK
jgi:hypothetical protein